MRTPFVGAPALSSSKRTLVQAAGGDAGPATAGSPRQNAAMPSISTAKFFRVRPIASSEIQRLHGIMIRPGRAGIFYIKFVGGLSADLDFFNLMLGAVHE